MSMINLKSISGEGFLTFYDPFKFPISDYQNQTVQIDGLNKDDSMSLSNGSGKSSLLEAVSWGLYGEICRKNKYKDEVIYNRNGLKAKRARLEVLFEERENIYKIIRSIEWKKSPELVLWVNETEIMRGSTYAVKQEHLEKILGMNFVSFQCCEMFGRDFMSFPDHKPADRAKILTDIRELEQYVKASKRCGEETKAIQISISEKTEELRTIEGRISQLREINYKDKIQAFEENRKTQWEELKASKTTTENLLKETREKNKKEIQKLETQIKAHEQEITTNDKLLVKFSAFDMERRKIEQEITRLQTNDQNIQQRINEINGKISKIRKLGVGNCPTCNQPITGEHLKKEISVHNKNIEQFKKQSTEIETQALEEGKLLKKIEIDIKHLEKVKEKNEQLQRLIYEAKTLVLRCEKSPEEQRHRISLENIEVSLKDIENRVNPYKKQEEERKSTLFDLVKQSKDIKTDIEALNQETQYYRFWVDGFKSIRISLFGIMLDRFQSFAQDLLSQYSSELQIQFSTERETRSGTMKEEFDISITDSSGTTLSYEMYSGGEKQKIRLSIAMALASMIKDDCGKDFNFIAFDEPNDALDEVGKEVNFEVFTKLAMGGKAVLVTDHDSIFKDKFDYSIMVVKKDDKSCI